MDILVVSCVSIVEAYALQSLSPLHCSWTLLQSVVSLIILQYCAVIIYRLLLYPLFLSPLRHLPAPKDSPFLIGQTYRLFKAKPAELQVSWMRDYPETPFIRFLTLGNTESLLVVNTRAHREVLQTKCYSFVKPPFWTRVVGEIAGLGLLFAEGEEHRKQRKLLTVPFSFGNIKNLLPVFNEKATELCSVIDRGLENNLTGNLEVSSLISRCTLDVIGLASLGYHLSSLSSSSLFADSYGKVFDMPTMGKVIAVINQFIPVRSWIPLSANREFVNANATIRRLIREHIHTRKAEIFEKGNTVVVERKGRDLLTLMIEERSGGVDPWTEEEMLNHLLNFMAAGHETTAGSLTWTLHALTLHPEIQHRLRREIQAGIPHSEQPSYEEIEGLHFLNNLVKEILRFYPPAPLLPRQASIDMVIDGVTVPKGTVLVIVPAVSHFNETIWGPTADEFDPDRFDNLPTAAKDPFAFEPFINGPRICIGKAFALLEYKAILIELVRNFEFTASGKKVEVENGVSLRPKGGLELLVRRIQ